MATRYANAVTGKNVPPKHFGRGSILPRTIRDSGRLEFNPPETINKAYADTGTKKGTPLVFSHQGSAQDPTDGRFKKIMATQHLKSTTGSDTGQNALIEAGPSSSSPPRVSIRSDYSLFLSSLFCVLYSFAPLSFSFLPILFCIPSCVRNRHIEIANPHPSGFTF
ncbi:hypothetical protein M0657_002638 [Pyricularia oryzae]|nr:hypothetical protein M9X92_002003 [Pyricularia oryzae]KAI7928530.1 hypothetical protein M0657_002638 [Pyricularia oryzae]